MIQKTNGDWWSARRANGQEGYVPANYVKEIEPKVVQKVVKRPVKVPVKVKVEKTGVRKELQKKKTGLRRTPSGLEIYFFLTRYGCLTFVSFHHKCDLVPTIVVLLVVIGNVLLKHCLNSSKTATVCNIKYCTVKVFDIFESILNTDQPANQPAILRPLY